MTESGNYKVWMTAEPDGTQISLVPYLESNQPARLRYELVSTKRGPSGFSRSHQSGTVAVAGRSPRELARLTLSIQDGDRCEVTLQAYAKERLVAAETLLFS